MNTRILRFLRRWQPSEHTPHPLGIRSLTFGKVAFDVHTTRRGAGGHSFRIAWFPCWLLTCSWDVTSHALEYNQRGGEKLRDVLREMLKERNVHYLPPGAGQAIRDLLEPNEIKASVHAHLPQACSKP